MKPVIELKNVSKRFGSTVALGDVSLSVPPGVVCAVLGMNSNTHALEIRQRVGYVADQPPLYDWMSVSEIGWFAAGFYPTGYQAEYDRLIRRFELKPEQKIKGLSKGMKAKVALSLAMAHRPELLILDEPTSGLDPLVRREFLESMIDISAEGRTVLLASHQVSEVERVADIVAILLNGKLVCMERLEDLKRETQEVLLSLSDETAAPPEMPGNVLAHVPFGHEHVWMVRNLDTGKLLQTCTTLNLPAPQIRHPNLEDILLALLREYRRDRSESLTSKVTA